jgi:hypothetical protein
MSRKVVLFGLFLFPNARRQGRVEAQGIKYGRLWETGQDQWAWSVIVFLMAGNHSNSHETKGGMNEF